MTKNECPKCGDKDHQVWNGKNPTGTQKFKCMKCGRTHTPNPKHRGYPEVTRQLAIKMHFAGSSGRTVGKVMGFSKANIYNWAKKNPTCVDK